MFGRKNPNGVAAFLVSYFRNESSDNLVAEIVPLDGKHTLPFVTMRK